MIFSSQYLLILAIFLILTNFLWGYVSGWAKNNTIIDIVMAIPVIITLVSSPNILLLFIKSPDFLTISSYIVLCFSGLFFGWYVGLTSRKMEDLQSQTPSAPNPDSNK